jgi:hypothetical protein
LFIRSVSVPVLSASVPVLFPVSVLVRSVNRACISMQIFDYYHLKDYT